MIRDPSDGSIKSPQTLQEKYGPNWGLSSLDQPKRTPKPAPTIDELRDHYAKHGLGFTLKQTAIDGE